MQQALFNAFSIEDFVGYRDAEALGERGLGVHRDLVEARWWQLPAGGDRFDGDRGGGARGRLPAGDVAVGGTGTREGAPR